MRSANDTKSPYVEMQNDPRMGDDHITNPWYRINQIGRDEIFDVIKQYDRYIQAANEANRYCEGWYPVCFAEFYDCEYQQYLEYQKDIKNGDVCDDGDYWNMTEE